ncbi:MAG: hypothetical protein K1X79_01425 [Oligoflexia bacterium]|nr:hypothetical protein [Oligoflexia bacterium]
MNDLLHGFSPPEWKLISTLVFLGVFLVLVFRVYASKRRTFYKEMSELPLLEDQGSKKF